MHVTKDSFDAALIPGARDRLVETYRALRIQEKGVSKTVLGESGEFRPGMAHSRNCPLCGTLAAKASLMYLAHGMHIVRCSECDLVYSREVINNKVDETRYRQSDVMMAHMTLHSNSAYAELEHNKARYIVGCLARVRDGSRTSLLDIGCSTGALLQAACEAGWDAVGIELNPVASRIAVDRGFTVIEGSFPRDAPSDRAFDVITMLDVLEHVEDPVVFLSSVAGRLLRGGVLAIQVPNLNSLLIRLEGEKNNNICHGHWSYFTSETLAKLAEKVGLTMLSMETIISEIDRIRAIPEKQVVECARTLTGRNVEFEEIDHVWLHTHLLGYKLLGIFSAP